MGQCIINRTCDNTTFSSVKEFILSEYLIPDDAIVVLGYNQGNTYQVVKNRYPDKRIIVYQLEQLSAKDNLWYNESSTDKRIAKRTNHIKDWLQNCDEIWEYDLDNIEFLKEEGYTNISFKPLFKSDSVNYNFTDDFKYDIAFYGALNDRRVELLKELDKKYNLLVIYNYNGVYAKKNNPVFKNSIDMCFSKDLFKILAQVKVVINIHYYEGQLQEQVRLFELLSNNKYVISEKSKRDYFDGIIPEFSTNKELFELIDSALENDLYNNSIKVGVAYNTFYGVELIESNIKKFRDKVHYIIAVHQKIGLSGDKEPKGSSAILEDLKKRGLLDEVVYYTVKVKDHSEMAAKRNVALEYCKKAGCDYIVPLDSDESYDFTALNTEISKADKRGVTTIYSPIRTYYYDKKHYFDDFFYVPSAYKIDDRIFEHQRADGSYVKTSVLVDPNRKMREDTYTITDVPLLHYNYLVDFYDIKLRNKIAAIFNPRVSKSMVDIYKYLKQWKPGQPGKIFRYINGTRTIIDVDLKSEQEIIKKGYTSDILIKENTVYKTVRNNVTRFGVEPEELISREIYWLKKLEKYNVSPRFIERRGNTILMSYCGRELLKKDLKVQDIQIQLIQILGILLKEGCVYNDFKLNSFTINNNKLYIIDFGWCPKVVEDYTLGGETQSSLKEKPYGNVYQLFENNFYKSEESYEFLSEQSYFNLVNRYKEDSPEHWLTNMNGTTFDKRWEYHREASKILKSINPTTVIEAGTMGVKLWQKSDTIDYNMPKSGWKLVYTPTYNHDLRILPWPAKKYDVFVALRVFQHLRGDIKSYLKEMERISQQAIIALPKVWADRYSKELKPYSTYQCKDTDTVILHYKFASKKPSLSVGLVYSGRVPGMFDIWMKQLLKDTEGFDRELIIINNSGKKLNLNYDIPIKEIMDNYKVPTEDHKLKLSQFLARSYSRILKESKGELIHLREDDIVPLEGSFSKMVDYILSHRDSALTGVYQSRNVKSKGELNNTGQIVEVDAFGTGMVLFWKNRCPNQFYGRLKNLTSHDWCWCHQCKEAGVKLYTITGAVCKHYTDDKNYVLPSGKLRPSAHFIKPKEEKLKRVIIKQK